MKIKKLTYTSFILTMNNCKYTVLALNNKQSTEKTGP